MRHFFVRYSFVLLLLPAFAQADPGTGCAITIIQPLSAADRAGTQLGDVMMEAGGKSIGSMDDLQIGRASCRGRVEISVGAVSFKKKKKKYSARKEIDDRKNIEERVYKETVSPHARVDKKSKLDEIDAATLVLMSNLQRVCDSILSD